MNEWNQWETHLRSWTPRPPSARLKEQIFGHPSVASAVAELPHHGVLAWLTPATCATLFLLACWFVRQQAPGGPAGSGNLLATLPFPGHTSASPALAMDFPQATHAPTWNDWSAARLDLTKAALSISTTGIFASWKTNTQKL